MSDFGFGVEHIGHLAVEATMMMAPEKLASDSTVTETLGSSSNTSRLKLRCSIEFAAVMSTVVAERMYTKQLVEQTASRDFRRKCNNDAQSSVRGRTRL